MPVTDGVLPLHDLDVAATTTDGTTMMFMACRWDTPVEGDYHRHGGSVHDVLRDFSNRSRVGA